MQKGMPLPATGRAWSLRGVAFSQKEMQKVKGSTLYHSIAPLPHTRTLTPCHLQVMRRAHWDDEREVWVLERLSDVGRVDAPGSGRRPVSAAGHRRPTSSFAKIANAMGDMNPRFKGENILNLELDMPERTTYDYEGPGVDARVQVRGTMRYIQGCAGWADRGERGA